MKFFASPSQQQEYLESMKESSSDVLSSKEEVSVDSFICIPLQNPLDRQFFPLFYKLQIHNLKYIYSKHIISTFPHITFSQFVLFAYLSTQRDSSVFAQYQNANIGE